MHKVRCDMRANVFAEWTILCLLAGGMAAYAQKPPAPFRTIVDTANREPGIRQAWTCFAVSGLFERLKGEGPWTVFIPSDEAIAKLSPEQAAKLRDSGERALRNFSYHVVRGKHLAADLAKLTTVDTLQGQPLQLSEIDGAVAINGGARIVRGDILCRNGVIHIVDTMLYPIKVKPYRAPPSIIESGFFRSFVFFLVVFGLAWLVLQFRDIKRVRKERRIASRPR